ncbi:hypothetical protein BCY76_004825 [Nesterenkonia sp. PF2B19]|nr:hypothetical protein BCY76_004825 [Nesterenkonia sp. PF2B19]
MDGQDLTLRTPNGLAGHLQQEGCGVFLMDCRGHGRDLGSPTDEGRLNEASRSLGAREEQGFPPGRPCSSGASLP